MALSAMIESGNKKMHEEVQERYAEIEERGYHTYDDCENGVHDYADFEKVIEHRDRPDENARWTGRCRECNAQSFFSYERMLEMEEENRQA